VNIFQKAVAKTYGGGDYAYMADLPAREAPEHYNDCGDTLFTFLMRELADEGEKSPMDQETAVQRLQSAMSDLNHATGEVESLDVQAEG
jgi:hypothetical protein